MTLQQLIDEYLGKQIEYHSYSANANNQCVDLVNFYIDKVLNLSPIIGTNAKDFPTRYQKAEFDYFDNTPNFVPKRGDIAVWNGQVGGGAGHVSIVLDATLMRFKSLDQNWSQTERVTEETHTYQNVDGFLRPKEQPMPSDDGTYVDKETFERLVKNSTFADQLYALGYQDIDDVKDKITNLEQANTALRKKNADLEAIKSRYEEFQALGYSAASQVKRDIDGYSEELQAVKEQLKTLETQLSQTRASFKQLLSASAKAVDTVQELEQVLPALEKLENRLAHLEDIEVQYAELQETTGKQLEELRAEVAYWKSLANNSLPLSDVSDADLASEVVRRLTKIINLYDKLLRKVTR